MYPNDNDCTIAALRHNREAPFIYNLEKIGLLLEKSTVNTKQKLLSSIFNEKLVFDEEKYQTPILNKGLELITISINTLEVVKNKNERLSFDNLPLCTPDGSLLEPFLRKR